VGLRSLGKGANRTILDCLVGRLGRRSRSSAAAGVAGAGSLTLVTFFERLRGGSTGCS